jgi:hypothetical protein
MREAVILGLGLLLGCTDSTTLPLVDLPDLRVVTPPASRGSPVIVEVINSTPHTVSFEALACDIRLEWLFGDSWHLVDPGGECVGLPLDLPPGARQSVSVDTPPDQGGRFRALVAGNSPAGRFIVRSSPFDTE